MRIGFILAGLPALSLVAQAQDGTPIDLEIGIETVALVSLGNDDDIDAQHALGEFSLNTTAETILDNGTRLRFRGAFRGQKDHPARPGFTGGFGRTSGAPVGAFSGLSAGDMLDQTDLRGRLETAYLQIDGGYGELRLGRDQGVAARFHEGAPSALTHGRLDSPLLDPSGISAIRTRHDLTGPSAKLSYATPRILGLRGGISVTPDADADGLDRRPIAGTGLSAPDLSNAVEIALNGSHRFQSNGLRLDAALAWSTAETSDTASLAPYDKVETMSAGTQLKKDDWSLGASWLASNNGLPANDYVAWSVGAQREAFGADWSLSYGESEDDGARIDTSGWQFGVARELSKNVVIGVAYDHKELDNPLKTLKSDAIVIEITLSTEILSLSGN